MAGRFVLIGGGLQCGGRPYVYVIHYDQREGLH